MCEPVTQERKQNMYNTKSINESYIFRSIRKAAEICSGHFRTISAIFRKVSIKTHREADMNSVNVTAKTYDEVIKDGPVTIYDLAPRLIGVDTAALFENLKVGDIVFALMPLRTEVLMKIHPDHRIRPYVVVSKLSGRFIGYPCYSGVYGQNSTVFFQLDPEKYAVKKPCRAVLEKTHCISSDHLVNYVDHLSDEDMKQINRIIDRHDLLYAESPRFHIGKGPYVCSVIEKNGNHYYLYNVDGKYAEAVPLVKEGKGMSVVYRDRQWHLEHENKKLIFLDDGYVTAGFLKRSIHDLLHEYYKVQTDRQMQASQ